MLRYAIDDGTDFTDAQAQVQALEKADPESRKRLSTVVSLKGAVAASPATKEKSAGKRKADAGAKDGKSKKFKKRA
jgi:hypothetical protein